MVFKKGPYFIFEIHIANSLEVRETSIRKFNVSLPVVLNKHSSDLCYNSQYRYISPKLPRGQKCLFAFCNFWFRAYPKKITVVSETVASSEPISVLSVDLLEIIIEIIVICKDPMEHLSLKIIPIRRFIIFKNFSSIVFFIFIYSNIHYINTLIQRVCGLLLFDN